MLILSKHKVFSHGIIVPEISIAEVINVGKSLKESSTGWDHIPEFSLKQLQSTLLTVLLNLLHIL